MTQYDNNRAASLIWLSAYKGIDGNEKADGKRLSETVAKTRTCSRYTKMYIKQEEL